MAGREQRKSKANGMQAKQRTHEASHCAVGEARETEGIGAAHGVALSFGEEGCAGCAAHLHRISLSIQLEQDRAAAIRQSVRVLRDDGIHRAALAKEGEL